MVIGDALAISLIEEKNFSSEDFAKSHPAGELGKKLTTYVGDLAISGNKVHASKLMQVLKIQLLKLPLKSLAWLLLLKMKKLLVYLLTEI